MFRIAMTFIKIGNYILAYHVEREKRRKNDKRKI